MSRLDPPAVAGVTGKKVRAKMMANRIATYTASYINEDDVEMQGDLRDVGMDATDPIDLVNKVVDWIFQDIATGERDDLRRMAAGEC